MKHTNDNKLANTRSHDNQHSSSQNQKSQSDFTHFINSFFEIFSEKDRRESQIYNDIKCVDATKEYKL